jgi:branched-chain amino acid transport system ATP-binding protein
MTPILETKDLTMQFGGLTAVDNINFKVNPGEIVALIGPNGAGKTTFFNCVTGVYTPTSGDVLISPTGGSQQRINGLKPNKVTEKGLARTFQNIRLFQNMTVLENVMIGRHTKLKSGLLGALLRTSFTKVEENKVIQDSYNILVEVGLDKFVNELAKNLPYGAQRRLEIARAMGTEPALLLLDEPAAGMNPQETKELDEMILSIRDKNKISILLIEHDMSLVMSISEKIFVVDYGKLIAQGSPDEIKNNPDVIKAYLGDDSDA